MTNNIQTPLDGNSQSIIPELHRQAEDKISLIVPSGYRSQACGHQPMRCRHWENLWGVCNRVVGWSQSWAANSKRNLHLHGKRLPVLVDGDDVKPHLIEVGRRCAALYSSVESAGCSCSACRRFPVISVVDLLRDYDRRRFANIGSEPLYSPTDTGAYKATTFDGYLEYLANQRLLIIKDVGHGEIRGRVRDVFESLIRPRVQRMLPTFFSSDHSIPVLKGYFGDWLVNQMVVNGCDQVDVGAAA